MTEYKPRVYDKVRLTREMKTHLMKGSGFNDFDFKVLSIQFVDNSFIIVLDKPLLHKRHLPHVVRTEKLNIYKAFSTEIPIFQLIEEMYETEEEVVEEITPEEVWNAKCILCGEDALDLLFSIRCSNPSCQNYKR